MKSEIIPFGKYKNQPVEVLKNDKKYMEWLVNQDWFRERYPTINTLIVNNFHQPNDTPEHNQLVSCFLSDKFNQAFVRHVYSDLLITPFSDEDLYKIFIYREYGFLDWHYLKDAANKFNIEFEIPDKYYDIPYNKQQEIVEGIIKKIDYKCADPVYLIKDLFFEHKKGSDVSFYVKLFQKVELKNLVTMEVFEHKHVIAKTLRHFLIEVKPVISDDFPSIIRQCRDQGSNVIFFDDFTATGATLYQVKKMFPKIDFVKKSDVEVLMLKI